MLPNDNVPMSVGHLDHVLCLQLDGARDLEITWCHVWLSWYDPASRFMHLDVFLIQSVSFIYLVCRCASLPTTFALSQSMTEKRQKLSTERHREWDQVFDQFSRSRGFSTRFRPAF